MAKWIVRQTDRYLSSQTGRQIDRLAVRQNSIRQMQKDGQLDRQMNQRGRKIDRQIDQQTR